MKAVRHESPKGGPRDRHEPVHAGDRYTWEFIHGPTVEGTILDVEPNRRVAFTFGGDTKVDVLLTKTGTRTLVHLRQWNMATSAERMVNEHLNCRGAWIHFLTVLKSVLEYGADCRDKDPKTGGSVGIGFLPELS
jgi:uncharacterized protein YndB with AHSA1/START domain